MTKTLAAGLDCCCYYGHTPNLGRWIREFITRQCTINVFRSNIWKLPCQERTMLGISAVAEFRAVACGSSFVTHKYRNEDLTQKRLANSGQQPWVPWNTTLVPFLVCISELIWFDCDWKKINWGQSDWMFRFWEHFHYNFFNIEETFEEGGIFASPPTLDTSYQDRYFKNHAHCLHAESNSGWYYHE